MKIAITGVSGLIGQAVVQRFVQRGDEIIAIGRDRAKLYALFGDKVNCRSSDYTRSDLKDAINGMNVVVHLAARRIALPAEGFQPFYEANIRTTENVILASCDNDIGRFCQASSLSVYSSGNKMPCTEDDPPVPVSLYGISKLACEHLAALYAQQSPMQVTSLRIAGVIGYGDQAGEGFMLARFIRLAREKRPLQVWGEGVGARDMIYVEDVAEAFEKAIAPGAPAGVFNIGSGRAISVRELAETINDAFDNRGNIVFDHSKKEDERFIYMDSSRAESELGWKTQWSLAETFAEIKKRYM